MLYNINNIKYALSQLGLHRDFLEWFAEQVESFDPPEVTTGELINMWKDACYVGQSDLLILLGYTEVADAYAVQEASQNDPYVNYGTWMSDREALRVIIDAIPFEEILQKVGLQGYVENIHV